MVQCAKSVAINIDDQGAIDTWRRQNGLVSTSSSFFIGLIDQRRQVGSERVLRSAAMMLTNIPMSCEHLANSFLLALSTQCQSNRRTIEIE